MADRKLVNDDGTLACQECGKTDVGLFRDRPRGEKARFVCIACLPENMKPNEEVKALVDSIVGGSDGR